MWYKEKYRIVTENPYNKEKLNGLGLVIYSEWKDSFVNIIQKNEIKHLFLNYSLGWKCSDYTFLRYIKPIETLEIIDTHSVGIKNVEQQHELVTLCLNLPNANDIDYHAFYHLKNVFCYGDKRNDSLFSCNSIEKLYIDVFRIGDKHCIDSFFGKTAIVFMSMQHLILVRRFLFDIEAAPFLANMTLPSGICLL